MWHHQSADLSIRIEGLLSFLYSIWCKYVEVSSRMAKEKKNSVTMFYMNAKLLRSFPGDTQATLNLAGERSSVPLSPLKAGTISPVKANASLLMWSVISSELALLQYEGF